MSELARGVKGKVVRGGKEIFRLNSFSVNVTDGLENVTDFGSNGTEVSPTGVSTFTGSFSGQFPAVDTSTGGSVDSQQVAIVSESAISSTGGVGALSGARWKFIQSSKSMWHGIVYVSDYTLDNSAEGLAGFSGSWQANGRLTYATSTSTST